jgi:hypothetical protein
MTPCEHFQDQLLDHLYGLLDPPEANQLTEHLHGCAVCRAALTHAEDQKRLLAEAARLEFPELRFARPTVPLITPIAAPPVQAAAGERDWGRWALAAAVLLAVGGISLSGNAYWGRHDRVLQAKAKTEQIQGDIERLARQRTEKLELAAREVREAQQESQKVVTDFQQRTAQVFSQMAGRALHLRISGPAAVEAGALNEYQVQVYDRNRTRPLAETQLTAKLLDQAKNVVVSDVTVRNQGPGNFALDLPRNLPAKPNSELYLVVSAKGKDASQEVTEKLTLVPPVYLTHLATDKPMYQPGEVVHFRSLTLERFSLKPAQEELRLRYTITKPTQETVEILTGAARLRDAAKPDQPLLGPDQQPLRGVGAGDFTIPADAPGGEYTLTVSEASGRFPPQTRKFIVNRYEKSRLNKKLEFAGKSYGPGDVVAANVRAVQAETNLPVANRPVTAAVRLDGAVIQTLGLKTDAAGAVHVQFKLPAQIAKGIGSLSITFNDGGNVETIVRPIPIVLKKLQVEFFPEGGDLVAGVPNRVYFQARTMLDKPAELRGRIVDEAGQVQAQAQTLNDPKEPGVNQGMGRFEFTPRAGKTYELKIDSPTGIEGRFLLPKVQEDGVVLTIPTGVTNPAEPIRVVLNSPREDRQLLVGVYCRGRLMTHQHVEVSAGQPAEVMLRPEGEAGGVYRVTVFEEQGKDPVQLLPRAERLIYRAPVHRLNIAVKPDKKEYAPGEKVTVNYQATDEAGKPAPAVLMATVVDKRIIETADEKTYRSLPTHFLLTTEVRKAEDLEYADFLLGQHPKAAQALELLLGTQGWRRFAEQSNPNDFRRRDQQDATRLLVNLGRFSPANQGPKVTDFDALAQQQVSEEFTAKVAGLRDRLALAQAHQKEARAEGDRLQAATAGLQKESLAASKAYQAAVQQLDDFQGLFRRRVLPILIAMLLLVALAGLAMSWRRASWLSTLPYLATAACSVLVLGGVLVLQMRSGENFVRHEDQIALLSDTREAAIETDKTRSVGSVDTEPIRTALPRSGVLELEKNAPARNFYANPQLPAAAADKPAQLGVPAPAAMPGRGGGMPGMMAPATRHAAGGAKAPEPAAAKGGAARLGDAKDKAQELKAAKGEGKAQGGRYMLRAPAPAMQGKAGGWAEASKAKAGDVNALMDRAAGDRELPLQEQAREKRAAFGLGTIQANDPAAAEQLLRQILREELPAGQPADGLAKQRELERAGVNGLGAGFGARGRRAMPPQFGYFVPPPPPLIVREYAHQRVHGEGDVRADFTETLFWNPVLVLPDGKGQSSFELCDSTTTFQVLAAGHTLAGSLGAATTEFTARKPLTLEPKLPIEVTAHDRIDVPLALANNTDSPQAVSVAVQPNGLSLLSGKLSDQLTLQPHERNRLVYRLQPALVEGDTQLRFDGRSGPFTDSILRSIKVVPEGFPIAGAQSDMLEKVARHELVLPETWLPGTLKYQVTVYPSTLAALQKGLEALLREPNGCFEQTSTSNYPNLLILDYLRETNQARPDIARRAEDLLARGYRKLTSFECLNTGKNQREGYEWFGGTAPAHEALTAYGLLEFRDMARVYPVDQAMLQRTKNYLLAQRDGKGGFRRNPRALDSFGRAPDDITNAYIVWALTESGKEDDVSRELNALQDQAKTSSDPYFLALVGNSLLNRDRRNEANDLLKKLIEAQKPDGHLDAARTSITGSGGRDLQIETTSLTLLAWLKAQRPDLFNVPLQKAVGWIGKQRGGYGGFGSTQSTILALKALIAYAKANKKTAEAGELILYVGDDAVVRRPFAAGVQDALVLELPEPEKHLKPGKNQLRVEVTGRSVFPYTAGWTYQSLKPPSVEGCPVSLTTKLDRQTAAEGETVGLTARLENRSGKGQGMAVAIIGLPAGLTLPEDMKQLKDMARLRNNGTERGEIDAWETRGRELVLYWRDLAPDKKIEVHLDLICRVPGEYRGPASRGYLYYNADHKCWVEPLQMVIQPKAP